MTKGASLPWSYSRSSARVCRKQPDRVFGQARWSKSLYTQSFKNSAYVEDRFMQNLGIQLGVQYRRRTEDITNKYLFTPYNFVSVAVGASYPTRTGEVQVKQMMKHLGQQLSVSYGCRWSRYLSVKRQRRKWDICPMPADDIPIR